MFSKNKKEEKNPYIPEDFIVDSFPYEKKENINNIVKKIYYNASLKLDATNVSFAYKIINNKVFYLATNSKNIIPNTTCPLISDIETKTVTTFTLNNETAFIILNEESEIEDYGKLNNNDFEKYIAETYQDYKKHISTNTTSYISHNRYFLDYLNNKVTTISKLLLLFNTGLIAITITLTLYNNSHKTYTLKKLEQLRQETHEKTLAIMPQNYLSKITDISNTAIKHNGTINFIKSKDKLIEFEIFFNKSDDLISAQKEIGGNVLIHNNNYILKGEKS